MMKYVLVLGIQQDFHPTFWGLTLLKRKDVMVFLYENIIQKVDMDKRIIDINTIESYVERSLLIFLSKVFDVEMQPIDKLIESFIDNYISSLYITKKDIDDLKKRNI